MSGVSHRLPAESPHGFGGSAIDRSRPIAFRLNGRKVEGYLGDTVLSAALASGIRMAGRRKDMPLALTERFAPALVLVDAPDHPLPMDRAPAIDGAEFSTLGRRRDQLSAIGIIGALRNLVIGSARTLNHSFGAVPQDLEPWQAAAPAEQLDTEVAVIGGGVAGLSAALAVSATGRRVILLERTQALGGAASFFGTLEGEEPPDTVIERLVAAIGREERITVLTRTEAFRMKNGQVLAHQVELVDGQPRGRTITIASGQVVIATGASERLPVFPGNRTPGVIGSLEAFQLARRFGIWGGRQTLFNTPHSYAYRLALHAHDAGVTVQRMVDARIGPSSRFIDFCKATGITLASGLIASQVDPIRRNHPALRVGFAVAIDEITQDSSAIETEQLVVGGGWQPELSLWLGAGGAIVWDAANGWLAARGTLANVVLAGSVAGYRGTAAAIASGKAAANALLGKSLPAIEDKRIDPVFETPDAPTPLAPVRIAARGPAFLDRGATLVTRRAAAPARDGSSDLASRPIQLSLADIAAAVSLETVAARDAGTLASERCVTGGDIVDLGWHVLPSAKPADAPPLPAYLTGRFGPRPQVCAMYVADARFFEPGCLIFENSEIADPTRAVGVFYAPAPGNRSGGLAVLNETIPQGTTLYARDTGGAVAVKVLERVRIGG